MIYKGPNGTKRQVGCLGFGIAMIFMLVLVLPVSIVGLGFFVIPGVIMFFGGLVIAAMIAMAFSKEVKETQPQLSPDGNWWWNGQEWVGVRK